MWQENVEIVRKAWEAWSQGDMGALFDFYDPAVEWDVTHSYVPDMGVFHGHEGVRDFFRQWRDFFVEYHAEPEEFIDAGECVIVGSSRAGAAGRARSAWRCRPTRQVYRLRHGKAIRVESTATGPRP